MDSVINGWKQDLMSCEQQLTVSQYVGRTELDCSRYTEVSYERYTVNMLNYCASL